jgi:hypothetical protein
MWMKSRSFWSGLMLVLRVLAQDISSSSSSSPYVDSTLGPLHSPTSMGGHWDRWFIRALLRPKRDRLITSPCLLSLLTWTRYQTSPFSPWICWTKHIYIHERSPTLFNSTVKLRSMYRRNVCNTARMHTVQRHESRRNIKNASP